MKNNLGDIARVHFWIIAALAFTQAVGCYRQETQSAIALTQGATNRRAKSPAQRNKLNSDANASKVDAPKPDKPGISDFVPAVRLVADDAVRKQLNLKNNQAAQLDEIEKSRRQSADLMSEPGEGSFRDELKQKAQFTRRPLAHQLTEILDTNQQNRLAGISIVVNGPSSLEDPYVADMLKIAEEQHEKITKLRKQRHKGIHKIDAGEKEVDASIDNNRGKAEELRSELDQKVLAILTEVQKQQLKSIKRPPQATSLVTAAMAEKLAISKPQKSELMSIFQKFKQAQSEALKNSSGGDVPAGDLAAKVDELRAGAQQKMLAVLTPQQRELFASLPGEPIRPNVLTNPEFAAKLGLTEDQKVKLEAIRATDKESLRHATQEIAGGYGARAKTEAKLENRQSKTEDAMLAVLTVEQNQQFESLKASASNFDAHQLQASTLAVNKSLRQ